MLSEEIKKMRFIWSFARKNLVHLNLQLLYNCNFKCSICDFWKEPFNSYPQLTAQQVQIAADKLKYIGPLVASIGGGEPLMHKELFQIIRILSQNNFPVMICNGWFVNKENAKELFKAGLYEISISVDYASSEKHDLQRGKTGAYERALNALQTLHENRLHPYQRVHMISVVMDDNIDEIEPLIKIAKEIGVTYLLTFYSTGRGRKESKVSRNEISKRLLDLKKRYPEFVALSEFVGQFSEAQINGGISPCYAGKNLFNIDSQGNVTRCIDRLDDVAGNIITDDMKMIKEKLFHQYKNNDCCDCWTSCRGNIESIMYGKNKIKSYKEYYHITKNIAIN